MKHVVIFISLLLVCEGTAVKRPDPVRDAWKVDSAVEIWEASLGRWCWGNVRKTSGDMLTDLTVVYVGDKADRYFRKTMNRYDDRLRPVTEAESTQEAPPKAAEPPVAQDKATAKCDAKTARLAKAPEKHNADWFTKSIQEQRKTHFYHCHPLDDEIEVKLEEIFDGARRAGHSQELVEQWRGAIAKIDNDTRYSQKYTLDEQYYASPYYADLLPDQKEEGQKILVLDLDETIVHIMRNSNGGEVGENNREAVKHHEDNGWTAMDLGLSDDVKGMLRFVKMRPWAREMLDMAQNYMNYKIVIYTAGIEIYAQFMRCVLTSWGLDVAVTLDRRDCKHETHQDGWVEYLKDLGRVRDALRDQRGLEVHLRDTLMLENKPDGVRPQSRARGVSNWMPPQKPKGQASDEVLKRLLESEILEGQVIRPDGRR